MNATEGLVGLVDGHPMGIWSDGAEEHTREALDPLVKPTAAQVVEALGVTTPFPGDSVDREAAFSLAAQAFELGYNDIYDAWLADSGWRYGR